MAALFRPRYKRGIERERREIDEAVGDLTLVDLLDRNALHHGHLPALQWSTGESLQTITWASYRARVKEVAAGLLARHIEGGTFVGLMMGIRPEHFIADLGAIYAGAFPVSFYETLTPSEMRYIAAHCEVEVLVLENEEHLTRWEQIIGELPQIQLVVVLDLPPERGGDGVISWARLVAEGLAALENDPELVDRSSAEGTQDDLVTGHITRTTEHGSP